MPQTFLLIDHEEIFHFIHSRILQTMGISESQIMIASSGVDAIELIVEKAIIPDFIFVDVNMPDMNGFEFITALRQIGKKTEIAELVILSSSDSLIDHQKAEALAVRNYMTKPLTQEKVKDLLNTVNVRTNQQ